MTSTSSPNINQLWADLMIDELIRNGVDTFCISPGSRSTPLTVAVARHSEAKSFVHFDERGGAFRALGIVSATHRPCAIITTSGTAAANLFPAIIEASKKKLPLIVLTADRPPELRLTGAHQTIDQVKMYGDYVRWQFDMPCPTRDIAPEFVLTTIDQAVSRAMGNPGGPTHINCMYREPLEPTPVQSTWAPYLKSISAWKKSRDVYTQYVPSQPQLAKSDLDLIAAKIKSIKSGIIVVGKLSGVAEQKSVLRLAERLNWPVFPDIASGLRLGHTHKNIISYFDQILLSGKFKAKYKPDGVLHLGGRITSKRWYEYIGETAPAQYIMVLGHPLRNDPLHNVTTRIQCNVGSLCKRLEKQVIQRGGNPMLSCLQGLNAQVHREVDAFLGAKSELSEPQIARLLTHLIPSNTGFFMANSMSIREVDMYGLPGVNNVILGANRGASGIDGTIASAAGFSIGSNKQTTLLMGDLAFLHDLNSLAMLRDMPHPMIIVVLNNNGGGIFSFLPIGHFQDVFEKFFGTPHHLTFSAAADLFDLNYARPETTEELAKTYRIALKGKTATVIEIQTDRAYNLMIHRELQKTINDKINASLK